MFAWCYLTLAWNSMARTANVADVHLSHLAPLEEDSLGLRIPKSKSDQTGARAHLAWHLYANPNDFRQCCITALGALLLMDELHEGEKLFLGTRQESRFGRMLEEALSSSEGQALMIELGLTAISPHSSRKGSAAYASNGTMFAPSFTSITLRAGWSLGDVLGRYFHYENSMDSFLGRILCGLDVSSASFAVLPPHFKPGQVSDDLIWRCFPGFRSHPHFLGVLRFVLPSLVYHHAELVKLLPKRHRLHSSVLFMESKLRQSLEPCLESALIRPTGVPPHVSVMKQGASIESKLDFLTAHLIASNPFADSTNNKEEVVPTKPVLSSQGFPPPGFELPLVGPLTAWRLLLHGDPDRGWPPFCNLNPKDFPGQRNLRKRLSDWLFFYNTLRDCIDQNDQNLSEEEQFLKAWRTFDFGPSKHTTRPDQWKLSTVVLKLRALASAATTTSSSLAPEVQELVHSQQQQAQEMNTKPKTTLNYSSFF